MTNPPDKPFAPESRGRFEAKWTLDGWVVLFPWALTDEGYWWRLSWQPQMHSGSPTRQKLAEHYARELNKALDGEPIDGLGEKERDADPS